MGADYSLTHGASCEALDAVRRKARLGRDAFLAPGCEPIEGIVEPWSRTNRRVIPSHNQSKRLLGDTRKYNIKVPVGLPPLITVSLKIK